MGDKNKKDWNERDALYQYNTLASISAATCMINKFKHQVDEKQNGAGSCTCPGNHMPVVFSKVVSRNMKRWMPINQSHSKLSLRMLIQGCIKLSLQSPLKETSHCREREKSQLRLCYFLII